MTPLFKVNKEQLALTLRGLVHALILAILGTIATFLANQVPGLLQSIIQDPFLLIIAGGVVNALKDVIVKYISNEEGKVGGVI